MIHDFTFYEIAPLMGNVSKSSVLTKDVDIKSFSDDDLLLHVKEVVGKKENVQISEIIGSDTDPIIDNICKKRITLLHKKYKMNIFTFEFFGDVSFLVIKYDFDDKDELFEDEVLNCNYFITRKYEFSRHYEVYPSLWFDQEQSDNMFHLIEKKHNPHINKDQFNYHVDIMSYMVQALKDNNRPLFVSYKENLLKRSFTYSLTMTKDKQPNIVHTQLLLAKIMNHQYQLDERYYSQVSLFENITYMNAYEGTNFMIVNNDLGQTYSLMKPKVLSHYFLLFLLAKYVKYYSEKTFYELSTITDVYSSDTEELLNKLDNTKSLAMLRFDFENVSMHEHINLYFDDLQASNETFDAKEHMHQQFIQLSTIQRTFREKRDKEKDERYKYYLRLFSIIAVISSMIGFFSSVWGLIESAHNDVSFTFKTLFSGSNIEYLIVFVLSTVLIAISLLLYLFFNSNKSKEGDVIG